MHANPAIQHFYSRNTGKASCVIAKALGLSEEEVLSKISMGAVYVRKARLHRDEFVFEGDYVRFHSNPKRFEFLVSWKERIIANESEFVVVNKPHGLPTHETVDNLEENVRVKLSQFMGEKLLVTHRLDQPTGGLLLLAKNEAFRKKFNRWLEKGRVIKKYEALCEVPVTMGEHTHYLIRSTKIPKEMSLEKLPGSQECRLNVEVCEAAPPRYRLKIQLFTGRTHQIRAQLALLKAPIVGDAIYGSQKPWGRESIALSAVELQFEKFQYRTTLTNPSDSEYHR